MKNNNMARTCAAATFVGGFFLFVVYSPVFAEETVPVNIKEDAVDIYDETNLCEETTLEPTDTEVPEWDGKEFCEELETDEPAKEENLVADAKKDLVDEGADAVKNITKELKPVDGNKPWNTTIDKLVSPTKYEDENKLLKNYAKNIIGNPIDNMYTLIPGYGFLKTAPDDLADTAKAAKDVAKADGVWNTTKAVANLVDKGSNVICDAVPGGGYVKKVKNVAVGTVSYGIKKVTKLFKKWF